MWIYIVVGYILFVALFLRVWYNFGKLNKRYDEIFEDHIRNSRQNFSQESEIKNSPEKNFEI